MINMDSSDGVPLVSDDGRVVFASEFIARTDFLAPEVAPVNSVFKDCDGKSITDWQF